MEFLAQDQQEEVEAEKQMCLLPRILPPSPPPSPVQPLTSQSHSSEDLRELLNARRFIKNAKPNDVVVSVREGTFVQRSVVGRVTNTGVIPLVNDKFLAMRKRETFSKSTGQPLYRKVDALAMEIERTPSEADIEAYLLSQRPQSPQTMTESGVID